MATSPARVLVIGATGALGRPVVRGLRERGLAVRGVSRHPERGADLAELGAEMVVGDLADAASVKRALAGCTQVLACAHSLLGRGRWASEAVDDAGHRHLIDAARTAGVQRFVYTSAFGASATHPVDFFRTKHAVERHLAASGLDAVVLRPTAFMEHHVHQFNGQGVLASGRARLVGEGAKPRNFVAATDVAQFALRAVLEDPAPFRTLDIGGPDHASNAEVAAMYARAAGLALRVSTLPLGLARVMGAIAGPLHPGVARLLHLMTLPDDAFDEHFHGAAALERDHGLRLTRLQDFIAERVRDWRAAG